MEKGVGVCLCVRGAEVEVADHTTGCTSSFGI